MAEDRAGPVGPDPVRHGPLPPVLFLGALVVQGAGHFLFPVLRVIPNPWNLGGVVLIVAGLGVVVVADLQFTRAKTTVHPFKESTALVTTGIFGFTRNPMYLGMVTILFGVAVTVGTLTAFLVPPLFGWVLSAGQIRMEEERLIRVFGSAYTVYAQRVRRWL
ncbi:MAG: isoprenylcysteine carboxylmethyltransferase family protein [Gemmatimonadetes bacterium]|nr:isoprenylcysteine carboxylmethyltransferase family protein [Gemmatimonadota bacterium]